MIIISWHDILSFLYFDGFFHDSYTKNSFYLIVFLHLHDRTMDMTWAYMKEYVRRQIL